MELLLFPERIDYYEKNIHKAQMVLCNVSYLPDFFNIAADKSFYTLLAYMGFSQHTRS